MKQSVERIGTLLRTLRALVVRPVGLVLMAITLVAFSLAWPTLNARTFSGEIQDSNCASTAEHVEKECALTCVRHGAKWVLYDASKDEVYQLDDQQLPAKFAAQQVTIVGTFDKSTRMIHIVKIKSS